MSRFRTSDVWHDLRYGFRVLLKRPGSTLTAILILAIGIGANAAIFSILYAVLLSPYPYKDASRLAQLYEINPKRGWTQASIAPANFFDWQKQNTVFESMSAYISSNGGANEKEAGLYNLSLTLGELAIPVKALPVTASLFHVLGSQPYLGRTFREEETWAGHHHVAMLSYSLWMNHFGGDSAIIGKTIRLNARIVTVIGVMPQNFYFPSRHVELWIPLGLDIADLPNLRRAHFLHAIARLKTGVSIDQANAQLKTIAARLEKQYPDTNTEMSAGLAQMHQYYVSNLRLSMFVLLAAVVFVLLVACANLANIVLAQYSSRAKEISVRLALGASRMRLVRQFFIEGLILSFGGAVLGVLLAYWSREILLSFSPENIYRIDQSSLNLPVLLFTGILILLTPVLFSVLPALESFSRNIGAALKEVKSTGGVRARFLRNVLLIVEVSLSLLLLFGAGLLIKSFLRLQEVNPGFDARNLLTFQASLPGAKYSETAQIIQAFQNLQTELQRLPGVEQVAATAFLPLRDSGWSSDFTIENKSGGLYGMEVHHKEISPEYFQVMKIPLLSGRYFAKSDTEKTPRVVIINESLAHRYFGKENPIGHRVKFEKPEDAGPWRTIVGVVKNEKQDRLNLSSDPEIYESYFQSPQSEMTFLIRGGIANTSIVSSIRQAVHSMDPDVAPYEMHTMQEIVSKSIAHERFISSILGIFAAIAALLASVGVYGVVSYLSAQRTQEIGVRIAMGAERRHILQLMLAQALRPVVLGIAAGIAASFLLTRLLSSLLFQTNTKDPVIMLQICGLLIGAAALAAFLPARRACGIDPLEALRYE